MLTALLLFCTPIFASPLETFLKQPGVNPNQTAVHAVWADTGETILSHNADKPLIPASALKVVTAYCALKKLGPAYPFETRVYGDGPIQKGVVSNLMIQGEGDPSLVSERLWMLIHELKGLGLQKIAQDIYLDESFFSANGYPGRREKNHRAYNALTSALSVNFNAVPGYRDGKKHYHLTESPLENFARVWMEQFRAHNLLLGGKIKEGKTAASHLLYTFESKPLGGIVQDMNKFSNNFIAEQIVKHLGAKFYNPPGTTAKGVRVLFDCLKAAGVDSTRVHLVNGSGFSKENKIPAKALTGVLLAGARDFGIGAEFIASLSLAGLDGTMKSRKIPGELEGILRAKTGFLGGIVSLSGFVPAKNGRVIAFSILMNDYKRGLREAQKIQDRLLVDLRKH